MEQSSELPIAGIDDGLPSDPDGVDRSMTDYFLSLTPAERLGKLQQFADFLFETRRQNATHAIPEDSEAA